MDRFSTRKNLHILTAIILLLLLLFLLTLLVFAPPVLGLDPHSAQQLRSGSCLNLNDGKAVIEQYEQLFQPGTTVEKSFFIENTSASDVSYRLYLDQISGELADILIVTVFDGETLLYEGTARELSVQSAPAIGNMLPGYGRIDLTIRFHLPESIPPEKENATLSFTLCAQASPAVTKK